MDLSIVIVNYNTKDLTLQCLESIYREGSEFTFEVFVVDNASADGSQKAIAENFPQVRLIKNSENLGFSAANNKALAKAKGRYSLLLNSDTVVLDATLDIMIRYMDQNPTVGAAGCKVDLPSGEMDVACKRSFPTPENSFYHAVGLAKLFPKNRKFAAYNLTYLDENEENDVECLVGAFMLLRREVLQGVGLLDEKYFMYGEDIDWCYRIKHAGWRIVYYPKARIIHYKGSSSKKKRWKTLYEFHRAMYLFYNDHYYNKYGPLTRIAVYVGIAARFILVSFKNLFYSIGGVIKK